MKNFHKVRGKREFLFDDRELVVLGSGAAVICFLIFVLGFMVGQTFSEQGMAEVISSDLSKIADNEAMEGDPTFDDDDQSADIFDESEQRTAEVPEDESGIKKAEQSYFTVLPDKESYVEVEATPVRDTEAKAAVPQKQAQTAAVPQPATPIPPPAEDNPPPAQPQITAAVPALPKVPKNPSDSIQDGWQPAKISAPLAPGSTIYSVQVASSPKLKDSERLVGKFGERGYQAYIMQADLGEKGIWYRVRVGNLASRAKALILKRELEGKHPDLANSPYVITVSQ